MADVTAKVNSPGPANEELQIARENLDAYLELAWEIFEELQAGKGGGLTPEEPSSTIQERSSSK
jgi:hypothetical protein